MAFQGHANHLYQFSVIEDGQKANERQREARLKQQQKRQVIQENLALREMRRQQQLQRQQQLLQQQQQQLQQPQVMVENVQREETPPPEEPPEAVLLPPRPQKQHGQHRVLMNFEAASTSKWPRSRSCNRIAFIQQFDDTKNPFKVEDGGPVNQDDGQDIVINDANKIILVPAITTRPAKTRTKSKSLSALEPTTLTREDAEFIASTVIDILDKNKTYDFVKGKIMQDRHISNITKEEISSVQDVSFSTDTSTSTQGSSFHSVHSSQSTSPVNLNVNSGQAKFSPTKKVTPSTDFTPKVPLLKQKRQKLKDRFARYDEAASITIQQLISPVPQSLPQAEATTSAGSSLLDPPLRVPCSVCDNSRFFVFSPESRKKLSCSCHNRIVNNFGSTPPQSPTPEVSQHPSQQQRQEEEVTTAPPRRETRQRGVPRGIWDRSSHLFKPFK